MTTPTTPEKPTRTKRWHKTHRRIVECAAGLFYEHGINNVSVDQIASSAEVTKPTLYSHFESKDDLIAQCLDVLDLRYHEWFVNQVTTRSTDPQERLQVVFDVLDEWYHRDGFRGCAFINATVELKRDHHPARVAIHNHKKRTIDYLGELLADAGLDDIELARELMLLTEGATITALVQDDTHAARRAAHIAEALIESRRALAEP